MKTLCFLLQSIMKITSVYHYMWQTCHQDLSSSTFSLFLPSTHVTEEINGKEWQLGEGGVEGRHTWQKALHLLGWMLVQLYLKPYFWQSFTVPPSVYWGWQIHLPTKGFCHCFSGRGKKSSQSLPIQPDQPLETYVLGFKYLSALLWGSSLGGSLGS